jgi:subtilisin family serine protease
MQMHRRRRLRRGPISVALLTALVMLLAAPAAATAKTGAPSGLSPVLAKLAKPAVRELPRVRQAHVLGVAASGPGSLLWHANRVLVYVRFARGAAAAPRALRNAGARIVDDSRRYQIVTARVSPADLRGVAKVPGVLSISPVRAPVLRALDPCEGGSVISEGVKQLNVKKAREEELVKGEGLTVGVLSDSFDQATEAVTGGPLAASREEDEETADLPGDPGTGCAGQEEPVDVLEPYEPEFELEEPFDEGRAMLQIVHDLAPDASLAFHSAFNGELDFAKGIEDLAKSGPGGANADVIVDDVGYFEEPFFQDGPVGAAVDEVTSDGAVYLSAAGNDNLFDGEGNEIASWEAPEYRDTGDCPSSVRALSGFNAHHCMDFNPGAATDRTFGIKVEPHEVLSVDLQWAEPWFGVETDLDAFLLNANGGLLTGSSTPNEELGKPVEIVQWENASSSEKTVQLVINRFSGVKSPPLKFILLQNGGGVTGVEYPKSGGGDVVGPTVFGHAGSASAIAVGAVRYEPREGEEAGPEFYSSRGPVTHYFGPVKGKAPASPIGPEAISKPDVAATDCGATTFFAVFAGGEWHFCGTSAAAPHAAGVAALMLDREPGATPGEIREALVASAQGFAGFGPCAQGGGLVEALGALQAIAAGPPFAGKEECEPPESPAGEVFVAPGEWGLEGPPPPPPPQNNSTSEPPPLPSTFFRQKPPHLVRTRARTARVVFRFGSDQTGVTFACRIDAGLFRPCGERLARRFGIGAHVVRVFARNADDLGDETPAVYRFRVKRVG